MKPEIVFYYRNGCHLCEDMWQLLQEFRQEHPFQLESVDVDLDDSLRERFGTLVPVLAAGEQIICHYYLDPVALKRHLGDSTASG